MLMPKGGITLNTENVGTLIFKLRKEKGMTQQELADKLQLTDKAVSKWERGLACPDISILPQVAEILGVSVDDLLSNPQTGKWHSFKELNRDDAKEIFFLLIRCVSLALSIGGLVIYLMGKLSISDLCIMLCTAVALLGIDSFRE